VKTSKKTLVKKEGKEKERSRFLATNTVTRRTGQKAGGGGKKHLFQWKEGPLIASWEVLESSQRKAQQQKLGKKKRFPSELSKVGKK